MSLRRKSFALLLVATTGLASADGAEQMLGESTGCDFVPISSFGTACLPGPAVAAHRPLPALPSETVANEGPRQHLDLRLETLLRQVTLATGINFVLEPDIDLDRAVPVATVTLAELGSVLQGLGLQQRSLANGDRLIERMQTKRLHMQALYVDDEPLIASALGPLAPTSVSATRIDGATAERLGDSELDDLFLRAANVFGSGDEFYIRGIPSGGDLNTLGNASAFVDGVPLPNFVLQSLPLNTWDLADTRFDRGPRSGDAAGPFSAYAGRIGLQPTGPAFDAEGRVLIRHDDRGGSELALILNRELLAEELAVRVTLDRQSVAGSLRSVEGGSEVDGARSQYGRVALLWEPVAVPGLRLDLATWGIQGSAGPQRLASGSPFDREGQVAPFRRRELELYAATLDVGFEHDNQWLWRLRLVGSDSQARLQPTRIIDQGIDPPYVLADANETTLTFADVGLSLPAWRGRLDFGLAYGVTEETERPEREGYRWNLFGRLARQSTSVGYQTAVGPWTITGRVRHNRDQLKRGCLARRLHVPDAVASTCFKLVELLLLPAEAPFEPFSGISKVWMPEVSVTRRASENQTWFGRYYRGANTAGAVSSATLDASPFWVSYRPERSDNAELGWRGRALSGTIEGGVTAFYGALERQWSFVQGDLGGVGEVTNVGSSHHYGVEFDGQWEPVLGHRFLFSIGWLKTRYGDLVPFERDAQIDTVLGHEFPGAPEYSGSLAYIGTLGDHWQVAVATSFHDDAFANANNVAAGHIPGVTLVDLKVTRSWPAWKLALFARNVFDKNYLATTPDVRRGDARVDYALGRPRSIGLTFELSF